MSDDSDFMQRWPGLEGTWPPIRFPTIEEAEEFENDLRAEIKRLRARGNSYAEISRATGVSVFKVTRLAKIDEEERESK